MDRGARRPRRLKFTAKVTLYLLAAYVLMAMLFGSVYFFNARTSTKNRVVEEIARSSDRCHDDVQSLITQTENVYLNLLFDEGLYDLLIAYHQGDITQPQALTRISTALKSGIRNLDAITSVYLLSDSYVFYTQNSTYTSRLNVKNSAIYRQARERTQPFWSSTYDFTVEYAHSALTDAALPIRNRNLVSYVGPFNGVKQNSNVLEMWPSTVEKPIVSICVNEEYLRGILSATTGKYASQCSIIDPSGAFISHTDPARLYTQADAGILELLDRQKAPSGVLNLDSESESGILHYSRLSNGWTLCMFTSDEEMYFEIYGVIWSTLTGMLLGTLVLCVALSLLVSHNLSLPIKQLLQAINITGSGNFMVNLPHTGDEFDTVNTAFNDMAQRINALIHENYEVKLRERENELRALKYQTKPHFLYNALTIIRNSALQNGDGEAAQMLLNLSNVLRYVLRGDQNLATVRDEINNVMDYFELMRAGYNDAISLEIDVEPGMLNAAICKMTLQPLVENCVQHGMANLPSRGIVRVIGRIVGQSISLIVSDNGSGWPADFRISDDEHQTESIGLANVRRRMKLTFGDDCDFRLFTPAEGGAAVEIVFPYRFGIVSITEI